MLLDSIIFSFPLFSFSESIDPASSQGARLKACQSVKNAVFQDLDISSQTNKQDSVYKTREDETTGTMLCAKATTSEFELKLPSIVQNFLNKSHNKQTNDKSIEKLSCKP